MNESKFNSIKSAGLELTVGEWKRRYPALTEGQIKTLTTKEKANEPSRKSVFGFTKTDD